MTYCSGIIRAHVAVKSNKTRKGGPPADHRRPSRSAHIQVKFLAEKTVASLRKAHAEGRAYSSGPLVEKHVKRYDPAVPHDDEIPPGVRRHFTRASRYPWNHPCIAIFLRSGRHLIPKVRMSRLDRARDAIDLVTAPNSALAGIVEHAIFGPDLINCSATTH